MKILFISYIIFFIFLSTPSYSYVGLGPLIPLLGNAIIFIFLLFLSILGIIFYPILKFYKSIKQNFTNAKKKNK